MDKSPTDSPPSGVVFETIDRGIVEVEVEYDRRIGLAHQQSRVPVVRRLAVRNQWDRALGDIDVVLWIEPAIAPRSTFSIPLIEAHSTFNLLHPALGLSAEPLSGLVQRSKGTLWVEVRRQGCGPNRGSAVLGEAPASPEEILLRQSRPLELLAFHEWGGLTSPPELLAAFVDPSHSVVAQVLSRAGDRLEAGTGDGIRQGYCRRDPSGIREILQEVYLAVQEQALSRRKSPPDFHQRGQKILTLQQVMDDKTGTALDLVLLLTACLEGAGLHPLIWLAADHVYAGVWLVPDQLPEAWCEDADSIRRRVETGDLAVFDGAAVASRTARSFAQAEQDARGALEDVDRFLCLVDLKTARDRGIQPLRHRVPEPLGQGPVAPRDLQPVEAPGSDRLAGWKVRLLDLSLRNRLVNFRESSRTVRLLCADLGSLEDALAAGSLFQILALPEALRESLDADAPDYPERPIPGDGAPGSGAWNATASAADQGTTPDTTSSADTASTAATAAPADGASAGEQAGRTDPDRRKALDLLLRARMRSGELYCPLPETRLNSQLLGLYRAARTAFEESGANTLYLALGLLAWHETPRSKVRRLAPLILLPVELSRISVKDRFRLQLAEEEARINITLLEKLRREYGVQAPGMEVLPQDADGLDIPAILQQFRQAISQLPGWEVLEQAHLGLFSFTKHLMYQDLEERTAQLSQNPFVQGLLQGAIEPEVLRKDFVLPPQLDEVVPPDQSYCVLDADSTQMAAIHAVEKGMSLVIEGPPGTGKSQTIANLIAHCLARGQTVLFVSQKRAALDVVYRRLARVGLAPFCLELHSNKTRKSEVVRQIGAALDQPPDHTPDQWQRHCDRLTETRSHLNRYVQEIHRPRSPGFNLFTAISKLIGLRSTPSLPLSFDDPAAITPGQLDQMREAIQSLCAAARETGPPVEHPWRAIRRCEWDHAFQTEVREAQKALSWTADNLERSGRICAEILGLPFLDPSWSQLTALDALARLLLENPAPPRPLLESRSWRDERAPLVHLLALGKERARLWEQLERRYSSLLLTLDLDHLHQRFSRWSEAFILIAFFMLFFARRLLKQAAPSGRLPGNRAIRQELEMALDVREKDRSIRVVGAPLQELLQDSFQEEKTDWDRLEHQIDWVTRCQDALESLLPDDPEKAAAIREHVLLLATGQSHPLSSGQEPGKTLGAYCAAFAGYEKARSYLIAKVQLEEEQAWGGPDRPGHLDLVRDLIASWDASTYRLRTWCAYARALKGAEQVGLKPLADAHARGEIPDTGLVVAFEHSFLSWWVNAVLTQDPLLGSFIGLEHERHIERFRDLDSTCIDLARQVVRSRLSQQIPRVTGDVAEQSEIGILLRELKKKRRHHAPRRLFPRIWNLLRLLKPCLLMSPLSVAQYLDPSLSPFDLVVFDEASQIPPWDGVGAIARGKQVIVVGDPRQLPPTSFFLKEDAEELYNENDIEEMESILDECLVSGLPSWRLGLHYRSRHEDLISFSNHHYYDDRLITFPAAQARAGHLGIVWCPIPRGIYDRGHSRTNRAEAVAVVQEVTRRLSDPREQSRSLGIVTFSLAQQRLIEDLLERACEENPAIERFFSDSVEEPVFVKNLENVQGDERDVMIFSICYGPDRAGRAPMHFGPLNREGGERRLNVAITRAREQLLVFSTLQAEQIDLSRTTAVGVAHLKAFLQYARHGASAVAEVRAVDQLAEQQSAFEQSIQSTLHQQEWLVDRHVGHSSQRIDLAVRDPERPEQYLLGIELDGPFYQLPATARDRDRIRPSVLNGLQWNLHRIWSIDWLQNPLAEVERLERKLDKVRTAPDQPSARSATTGAAIPASDAASIDRTLAPLTETGGLLQPWPSLPAPVKRPSPLPAAPATPAPLDDSREPLPYQFTPVDAVLGTADEFYQERAERDLVRILLRVVEQEAPISLSEAARRVGAFWNITAARKRVIQRILGMMMRCPEERRPREIDGFLWRPDQDPRSYPTFRVPAPGDNRRRKVEDICLPEITSAVLYVLGQSIAIPAEDLARETARQLGISRLGPVVRERILSGVELLEQKGLCQAQGGVILIPRR